MRKVFFGILIISIVFCFILFIAPRNEESVFNIARTISQYGQTFRKMFYTNWVNFMQLMNKYSQIEVNINPNGMVSIDFIKDFSILGILKYLATLIIMPLYFIFGLINFYFSLIKSAIDTILVIFTNFVPIDELEMVKTVFKVL